MDTTAVVIAIIGFLGTLIGGYLTFRSKLAELKNEAKHESQTAIRAANELMFMQIQSDLTRRDQRIEQLEKKLTALEIERGKRQEEIYAERNVNRKLSQELDKEKYQAERLDKEINLLKDRVRHLEKENAVLKKQVNGLKTGMLG